MKFLLGWPVFNGKSSIWMDDETPCCQNRPNNQQLPKILGQTNIGCWKNKNLNADVISFCRWRISIVLIYCHVRIRGEGERYSDPPQWNLLFFLAYFFHPLWRDATTWYSRTFILSSCLVMPKRLISIVGSSKSTYSEECGMYTSWKREPINNCSLANYAFKIGDRISTRFHS